MKKYFKRAYKLFFLKLGIIGFGGPAVYAMMQNRSCC
jgi:chromate transport protein ChrA